MDSTRTLKSILAGALLSGGLAAGGLALGSGAANADGPHRWCRGIPKTCPTWSTA